MIYLDNSATTKASKEILETYVAINEQYWANPSSIHLFGHKTNELLETARGQAATILKTAKNKIYFTSGGTESNNLAIFGLANKYRSRGRHILVSEIEHPSVLEAARRLSTLGFEVEWIPVGEDGVVDIEAFASLLREDTVLVSVMHINNETGAVQPIKKIINLTREVSRAVIHVDAVQSFGKLPINFQLYDIDALTISSHKIHGLKGSGLLALAENKEVEPIIFGGGQESGIRSGTTPVPLAVCTAKAMRLADEGLEANQLKMWNMTNSLIPFLQKFKDVKIISPEQRAPHILTLSVRNIKGEVLINALQEKDVIVSTSSACSSRQTKTSHVLQAMHLSDEYINGVIRLSVSHENTMDEIEQFKHIFKEAMSVIKGD